MIRLALLCLLVPSIAHADVPPDEPIPFNANIGAELGSDETGMFAAMRIHLGVMLTPATGDVQPTLTLGATFGAGTISADDQRAADGILDTTYSDLGPELQLGLRFGRGGHLRNRLFVSVAYLRAFVDERVLFDQPEMRGGNGFRASVGGSWVKTWWGLLFREGVDRNYAAPFVLMLPHQVEVGWLRSAGSDRATVTLSWGI